MTTGVATGFRTRVRGFAEPVARGFGRLGLTPNHLTLIGFGISVIAAWLAAGQSWFAAGVLVLIGGAFDLLDGALARATDRVNRLGAFFDSVSDRAGESAVFIGIVIGCLAGGFVPGAIWAAAAMAAAFLVSYTRAKSEGLGFTTGTGMASVGLMPREVRIVLLGFGLLAAPTPIFEALPPNSLCGGPCDIQGGALGVALLLIAVGGTLTTIQRIVHVINQSRGDTNS